MSDMKNLVFLSLTLLFFSCGEEENGVNTEDFVFQDGFENTRGNINALFPNDGSRWSNLQIDHPSAANNEIAISTSQFSEGQSSLYILSRASDNSLSKADIEKGGFQAGRGQIVTIEADFYIDSDENIADLLLIDLECCSCWDPSVPNNQCPGIRLMMSGGNDNLSIERGKILEPTIQQTSFRFPRRQWVRVVWQLDLSDDDSGRNQLFINDQQAISVDGVNMPNPVTFRQAFEDQGMKFTLQTPVFYERVQIGATANPTAIDIPMYVDNFRISISNP